MVNDVNVLPSVNLLEAVLHPADAVGHKGKVRAVKDGFLDTVNEAEAQVFADFADLKQNVEVEDKVLVLAGAHVIEQFVHHQEQTVFGKLMAKSGHQFFEGMLVDKNLPGDDMGLDKPSGESLFVGISKAPAGATTITSRW